jgi:nitroreductase
MQTWEAIRSRRNVREFTGQPIADDHLDEILESGRRAPSSKNWQPWDFVVVRDRGKLQRLSHVSPGAGHVATAAAAIALISPVPATDLQKKRVQFDLGQVAMSLMLAAAGLAIGSGQTGVSDEDLARELLGFPEDRFCPYVISLGYPADRPLTLIRRPDRRPLSEIVHRERWLSLLPRGLRRAFDPPKGGDHALAVANAQTTRLPAGQMRIQFRHAAD